jgi:hypothetical protein
MRSGAYMLTFRRDPRITLPWVHSYIAYVNQNGPLQTNDKIALGVGLGLGIPTFIAAIWQMARWYFDRDYPTPQPFKRSPDSYAN